MQIYQTVAYLFRPAGPRFELYETEEDDIKPVRGLLFTLAKEGARGLRVTLHDEPKK